MKHHTPSFASRNVRAFSAGLLSYLLLAGQMAPLALASTSSATRLAPSPTVDVARESAGSAPTSSAAAAPIVLAAPAPAAFAPIISATKTDSFTDVGGGQAAPGSTITYTITINNTGPDPALNLTLNDTVDPNTTIVPGSAVSTPIAADETYSVLGNVRIQPNAAGGLLANDNNPNTGSSSGLTASGPTTGPTNGQATVNADGSFSYNPNPGFTGTDTFTYTVTSSSGTDTATVTLNVAGMIWFVDDSAAAGGDGRLTTPFSCLVGAGCFDPVAADDPGDAIFLYAGTYPDTGALTLLNSQQLIGQGANGTLEGVSGFTLPPHSDALPTLNNDPSIVTVTSTAAGIILTAGNLNTLRGFTLGNNGAGAKIQSTSFGTLTVRELALSGTGQALNLDSGALDAIFTSIASTTSGGQGINLDQVTGSLAASSTSITDPATQGILVTGSTANINFGNTTVSDATDAISLQNNSAGTRTFGTITTTGGTGVGFLHSTGGGVVNVTGATSITNPAGVGIDVDSSNANLSFAATTVNKNSTGNIGVDLTSNATRTIGFTSLTVTTTNAFALNTNNSGTVNAGGGSLTQSGAGGGAASLTNTALGLTFTSVSSSGGANGVIISGGSGTFTSGTTNLQNNAGVGLLMSGSSAVAANFGNTTVNSSAGDAVDISGNTGNVTFADLDLTPDSGLRGLDVATTTGTITSTSGDIATTNAPAINIIGASAAARTPLAMTLTNVDATVNAGQGIDLNFVSGNLTVNDATLATNITTSGTGAGIRVQNTAASGTMNFGITTVTGTGSGTAVVLGTASNGNAGSVTFPSLTVGVSTATRYSGAGVSITDGASTSTVSLGTLNIFANNQAGLSATNFDGTLNATSGTVDTGTGASVNLDGPAGLTTLGVSLTRVVSAGGTTPGITVRDTNGSFAVVGSGGTCTDAASCTGGSISGKTGSSETTGTPGVRIINATNIRLTRVNISGGNHAGIYGGIVDGAGNLDASLINGFQLDTCNITENGNQVVSNPDESGVTLYNLVGTASGGANPTSIINSRIFNNHETQVSVANNTATDLVSLDVSGNTITDDGTSGGIGSLILFLVLQGDTADMTLNVTSGTFTGAAPNTSDGIQCDHSGSGGLMVCNVSGGTFNNNNVAINTGVSNAGNLNFILQNNSATNNRSHGLNLFINAASTGTVNGRFLNNIVGTAGSDNSGSDLGNGIRVQNESQNNSGAVNVLIMGNTVQEVETQTGVAVNTGITGSGITANKATNATITNNTISGMDDGRAIIVSFNDNDPGATGTMCADISGNEMNNISGQVGDGTKIRVRQLQSSTFFLRQTNAAGLATANSPPNGIATTTTTAAQVSTAGTLTAQAGPCTQPSNAPETFDEISGPGGQPVEAPTGAPAEQAASKEVASNNVTSRPFVSPARIVRTQAAKPAPQTAAAQVKAAPAKTQESPRTTGRTKPKGQSDTPSPRPPVIMGDNLTWNIGTLPAGQSVTITFQVTVDNPFMGAQPQVSNQGTVTADGGISVLTDDPSVGGMNDPTVTPILAPPDISVRDAKVAEPSSGSSDMVFTVVLSAPAASTVSVNFTTADETPPGPGKAVAGTDYTTTTGTVTFMAGERLKTIQVPVLADADAGEPDETFLLDLSMAVGGNILDAQATGTITAANPAGTFLISELRSFGPGGSNDPNDDFIELFNNSDSPLTVAASDASAGFGVITTTSADCDSQPVLLGTIPNGTVIPARGHYLLTGSAYSLANYGGTGAAAGNLTMAADFPTNANVAVFSTSDLANLSTVNRLDAVGFGLNTQSTCSLLREGATAPALSMNQTLLGQYSFVRDQCGKQGSTTLFGVCPTGGAYSDTNASATDFFFVDPTGVNAGAGQRMGAAGPENIASPIRRDATFTVALLDASAAASSAPNRVRDFTSDPGQNSTFGTLSIRRRVTNNTGGAVTRLRFRVVDISTFGPQPSGIADLRARTSSLVVVSGVNDAGTCLASNGVATTPCTVNVQGTTLEEPPTQANGGGINSTLSAGTITTGTPLAAGASINLQFLLGIEQTGSFKFYIIVEALP